MARPCYHCLEIMKAVNIRYCYYSTFEGTIIREKVCNMISIQMSNNTKRNLKFITYRISNKPDCNDNNHINKSKNIYYETLMKQIISQTINKSALENFIRYNFKILFPETYYYVISQNKITFYNNMNTIITNSIILV